MTEATLVVDDQLTEVPAILPQISQTSLATLDQAVLAIEQQANAYICANVADYTAGGAAVERIRNLKGLYERCYKPLKQWWDAEKKKVLVDEQARTGRLETAKTLIGERMLAYKQQQDRAALVARQEAEAREKARAESDRLALAAQLEDRGNATGSQAMKDEAVALLDRPLDVAPVHIAASVPKLGKVKTVERAVVVGAFAYGLLSKLQRPLTAQEWESSQEIIGKDLEDLIICVGASLLAQRDIPSELKVALQPYVSRCAEAGALKADAAWIKKAAAFRGADFALGGVQVVKREGLG